MCSPLPHLLCAVGARVAEALPSLEVALAIDAVAADEGAVLPVCPIPALGFTPGRDEGKWLEHPWHLGTSSILHMYGDRVVYHPGGLWFLKPGEGHGDGLSPLTWPWN